MTDLGSYEASAERDDAPREGSYESPRKLSPALHDALAIFAAGVFYIGGYAAAWGLVSLSGVFLRRGWVIPAVIAAALAVGWYLALCVVVLRFLWREVVRGWFRRDK